MIITSFIEGETQDYNERKIAFEASKDSLAKEPVGDVKKEYSVGCFQKSDWEFIHAELMKDGSLEDNIPTDKCECINDCLQSDIRGVYLLTETEADELRANPKVDYVNIKTSTYPGTYKINPDELSDSPVYRYSSTVKNQQQITTSLVTHDPAPASLLNRCSSQLYRGTKKKNPWVTLGNPQTIVDDRIYQYGTGVDVDVIVCDTAAWFGHIEFCDPSGITNIKAFDLNAASYIGGNSSTVAPSNFIGGNVLRSGFSASATTGICNVLDLALDSPYYIDPAWFEADAANRLTTRWDGTTVPVESVAREWWSDSTKRSATFASVGTLTVPSLYTRANCNGTNTSRLPNAPVSSDTHGTCCASQAYGRQYGWAYNANKWYLNLYGYHGMGINDADGFDMQKIFHENKPNRTSDNTKNPTISSNSWSRRFSTATLGSSGYYYYQPATVDGTTSGVEYTSWDMDGNTDGTGGTAPRFMTNRTLDSQSSGIQCEPVSGSAITGLNELIASGVIFITTAGNRNQKQVKGNHPDYNNYFSSSNNTALSASTFFFSYDQITYRQTLNRGGYPNAIPGSITVGALDDTLLSGKEKKVNYSGCGNHVDCYATANNSLAASATGYYGRYDSFYTYDSTQSAFSADQLFNGTSSACPIAVGLIATKLETNRTWTYNDVKNWLTSDVGKQDKVDFYYGTESTSANDTTWSDQNSLQGSPAIVVYDALVTSKSYSALKIQGNISFHTNVSPDFEIIDLAASVDEGQSISPTIGATSKWSNLLVDTNRVYWDISGVSIASTDFSSVGADGNPDTGTFLSGYVDVNGTATSKQFPIGVRSDNYTDDPSGANINANETATLSIYRDSSRTQLLDSSDFIINDTSTSSNFEFLLVGGGGAGGRMSSSTTSYTSFSAAGGGGAGGVRVVSDSDIFDNNPTIWVEIGAGGLSAQAGESTYLKDTDTNGAEVYRVGGGGYGASSTSSTAGVTGGSAPGVASDPRGSGGGGNRASYTQLGWTYSSGGGSGAYGNDGGGSQSQYGGGGGGGAGSVGSTRYGTTGGNGGSGYDLTNFFSELAGDGHGGGDRIAGGGGSGQSRYADGSIFSSSSSGSGNDGGGGGGGFANSGNGYDAAANTGAGGGGAAGTRGAAGGAGGSGIVYLKYTSETQLVGNWTGTTSDHTVNSYDQSVAGGTKRTWIHKMIGNGALSLL